jgi:hypothetical protein
MMVTKTHDLQHAPLLPLSQIFYKQKYTKMYYFPTPTYQIKLPNRHWMPDHQITGTEIHAQCLYMSGNCIYSDSKVQVMTSVWKVEWQRAAVTYQALDKSCTSKCSIRNTRQFSLPKTMQHWPLHLFDNSVQPVLFYLFNFAQTRRMFFAYSQMFQSCIKVTLTN